MPPTIEGTLSAAGLRFAIVAARFNGLSVEPLIAGAIDAIVRTGGKDGDITVVRCPGAWQLPQVVRQVLARGNVDAVIALGAVIRGATPHFDYVAGEAAKGLAGAAADSDIAVSFGVLTTDTIEHALVPAALLFARDLVAAASTRAAEIDQLITSSSRNWRLERMSRVDRNILRLGTSGLVAFPEVPVKVVINGAVELAKRFGSAESSAFVNGVLDRIATAAGRTPES